MVDRLNNSALQLKHIHNLTKFVVTLKAKEKNRVLPQKTIGILFPFISPSYCTPNDDECKLAFCVWNVFPCGTEGVLDCPHKSLYLFRNSKCKKLFVLLKGELAPVAGQELLVHRMQVWLSGVQLEELRTWFYKSAYIVFPISMQQYAPSNAS